MSVPTIAKLRARSDDLFTQLLAARTAPPGARPRARGMAAAPAAETFSWFDRDDGVAAAALSFRLTALAGSDDDPAVGLGAALDQVEEEMGQAHPELIRQGFAMFVTHNRQGRRLAKPRTVAAAPGLFHPPSTRGDGGTRRISKGGEAPTLDYWREDALANDHHQHWHEVYPWTGLAPQDFGEWVDDRTQAELVAILDAFQPNPSWAQIVAGATKAQLAQAFAQIAGSREVGALPQDLYRLIFRLNDRQGELFLYMHEQMLARYDAELLSEGLERVEPFGPSAWVKPIRAGYDPEQDVQFGPRDENESLPKADVDWLREFSGHITKAVADKHLRGSDGGTVTIDRTTVGEAVEATIEQLHDLDDAFYPGLHNNGHMILAGLSKPLGVMRDPVAAIRDQVFWQWHKFIDQLGADWQSTLDPYTFTDAPDVLVRDSLAAGAQPAWESPDIILCRTADLPTGQDPSAVGEQLFGGDANWSQDFSGAAPAAAGGVAPIGELTTTMGSVNFGGRAIQFLDHEPFSYFIRVESKAQKALDATVRIFLAPAAEAHDQRAWIEMDKFLVKLPAGAKTVIHREDTEASVVKRPVDRSPADIETPGGPGDEGSYCNCGWPYPLLLPKGNAGGMEFRLMVMLTDAGVDEMIDPAACGSVSWCGAVAGYPDSRDMGYPFNRPFAGGANAIRDKLVDFPSAAARTVTIKHV